MKIQVLGSGCAKCKMLHELTQQVIDELQLESEVEYLSGIEGTSRIIELGAMSSPVLAVNDTIAMIGYTPNPDKIKLAILKTKKATE